MADRTICAMPSRERSDVYDPPMRLPMSTRRPDPARPRFLQRLQFAHAHVGGKLVALGDGAFGVGRARGQRLFDGALGDFR